MNIIKSRDNLQVKQARKLMEKKYRIENKKFLIEGFRFVREALNSSFRVSAIFLSDSFYDKWEKTFMEEKIGYRSSVYIVTDEVLKSISSTESPQGVAAVVENTQLSPKNTGGFYVLADRIQDPGNMGTIIRSSHAAGALGVIITKGTVDIYNEKTLRSTMGSVFYIPIIQDTDLEKTKTLKQEGFKLIASSLDADTNFYNTNLKQKIIFAVGNEANGLSEDIEQIADIKARIPMPGKAESLNAAVAVSIMMFEAVRQNSKF
ncbi:TrmH family RNA methyltransferase [Clostridium sp. JNZ X4-2]